MADKRILTIQDVSCVGRCSTTVALPVLSVWGHETCILPTAVLSTHTGGFGRPAVVHLDPQLPAFRQHWKSQGVAFDAILVGYLGSKAAVAETMEIMDTLLAPGGIRIVDPAMADHGRLYSGLDEDYAESIRKLCGKTDVLLPNITEAALLTGLPYREEPEEDYVNHLLDKLEPPQVILTGINDGAERVGAVLRSGDGVRHYFHKRIDKNYHGTGDLFAACFAGALLSGWDFYDSMRISGDFVKKCIEHTLDDSDHRYGVRFETVLPELMKLRMENKGSPD